MTTFTNAYEAVKAIRDLENPIRLYVVCTGAGAGLQDLLWSIPGSSKFLIGASFPYASEATEEFLGYKPESAVSEETAIALAMEAYKRAWKPGAERCMGVGLTAAVGTTRALKGGLRAHVAVITEEKVSTTTIKFSQSLFIDDSDQRKLDGIACNFLCLNAILDTIGLPGVEMSPLNLQETELTDWSYELQDTKDATDLAWKVLLNKVFPGNPNTFDPNERLVHYPGSFNPPHIGHFGAAKAMRSQFGRHALFTICVDPPHKDNLSIAEALQRAKMLNGYNVMFTSGDPLYTDKSKKYKCDFIIGADALLRLLTWNGISAGEALDGFEPESRIFVVEREVDGKFTSMYDIRKLIPIKHISKFYAIQGRWDISSSEIRSRD